MSSRMGYYPFLVVQTGRMTFDTQFAESLTWGLLFIITSITITYLWAIWALCSITIIPWLVLLSTIYFTVYPIATSIRVLKTTAAAAATSLGPAMVHVIITGTAAWTISTIHGGIAGRSGSVPHCVCCILCRFASHASTVHVHVMHSSSWLLILSISISRHQNIFLFEMLHPSMILLSMSDLWPT